MLQLLRLLVCGAVLVLPATSGALTIAVEPANQTVSVGSTATAAVTVSGLGASSSPSLSTFDVDVAFDEEVLAFSSAAYGDPVKGDQLDLFGLGSITETTSPSTGTMNFFELSLDSAADLNSLQAGAFTLATVNFETLTVGTSPLGLSVNSAGDAAGEFLETEEVVSGSVSAVPEPSGFIAFVLGIAILRPVISAIPQRS